MLSHPHICGIGGIGTSGVALLLRDLGIPVTGSDLRPSELTQELESRGVRISYIPEPEWVLSASCVIVPAVFPKNHPELTAAYANRIPVLERTEALSWICRHDVKDLTLVFGTQARAQVARAIAAEKSCGYCTGMATRDGLSHAKFDSILVVDLDERSFFYHPELYRAFPGAKVFISDWAEESFGYYPQDFSQKVFCDDLRPHVDSLEILPPNHRWLCHAPQGIGWFESLGKGRYHEIRMHPTNVAAALKKLRQIADASLSERGNLEGQKRWNGTVGKAQDEMARRMEPQRGDIASASKAYVAQSGDIAVPQSTHIPILAVIKPFISTLNAYDIGVWRQVLGAADEVWVISPPYEGCTHQDCVEFVKKLCDSSIHAHLCPLSEAQEAAQSVPFSLWIGAPDIVSGF